MNNFTKSKQFKGGGGGGGAISYDTAKQLIKTAEKVTRYL